jgi:hypothetical protein
MTKEKDMACEFTCDGCGKKEKAESNHGQWQKPRLWFQRSDENGIQTACSRECIKKISEKTGKTAVVLPI